MSLTGAMGYFSDMKMIQPVSCFCALILMYYILLFIEDKKMIQSVSCFCALILMYYILLFIEDKKMIQPVSCFLRLNSDVLHFTFYRR